MERAAKVAPIIFILLFCSLGQFHPSMGDDIEQVLEEVMITEVLAYPRPGCNETEYIAIMNQGSDDLEVQGWRFCDGENCITLPDNLTLEPGGDLYLADNGTHFLVMTGMTSTEWEGTWPRMANDGDLMWLEDEHGLVIDAVALGRAYQGEGWTGMPGPSPREGHVQFRDHELVDGEKVYHDTNMAEDWPLSKARRAEHRCIGTWSHMDAIQVVPLEFPDDGMVLAEKIREAKQEVLVNTYELTSTTMTEVLVGLSTAGLDVRVLLERSPVGGIDVREHKNIHSLLDAGSEVRLTVSNISRGLPGNFAYDHGKYLVLDTDRTVIMSENIVPSAMGTGDGGGNRGWGVIIRSPELGGYFRDLFLLDWGSRTSLDAAKELKAELEGMEEVDISMDGSFDDGRSEVLALNGKAEMYALISPDHTEDVLLDILDGGEERIYVEQMSVDLEWDHLGVRTENPLLTSLIGSARKGVEVKVLLDGNFLDTSDNDEVVRYLNEVASSEDLDLEARLADIPNISMVHNKGLVIDDIVIVSSINWVVSAFRDNREVGIAISMEDLAEHYSDRFLRDWDPVYGGSRPGRSVEPQKTMDRAAYQVCGVLLVFGAILVMGMVLARSKRT